MTITVKELVQWLQQFPDQDAVVQVVEHTTSGCSYYEQGGTAREVPLDLTQHVEYVDLRNNPFVKDDARKTVHTLLLGVVNL